MNDLKMPARERVAGIRLAVSCEAIIQSHDEDESEAIIDLRHYFEPIEKVVGSEHVDRSDEPKESEYDSEWQVVAGSFFGDVSLEEWDEIASAFCLDIPEGDVLPEEIVPTMGTLGTDGITPAVAIEHTEEGYGTMWREPQLIASFYVAIAVDSDD